MDNIKELVDFCNHQAIYHATKAAEPDIKPSWSLKHKNAEAKFRSIATLLENPPVSTPPIEQQSQDNLFTLDPFDLGDLPQEVVEELKISKADTADSQIVQLLKIAGRPLSISEILVGLFRKFNVTHKRTALSARLYRMSQARILEQSEGERGFYNLRKKESAL